MSVRRITTIAMFTAVICVMTFVYVPTPWGVPITGQTLAVLVLGLVLSPKDAAISVALYLLLGTVGLPVFSGARSGIGMLLGPTGGYLWSFLIGAVALSWLKQKGRRVLGAIVFTLIVYFLGCLQLKITGDMTFFEVVKLGMLPFIPGDLVKIALALATAKKLEPTIGDSPA